QWQPEAVKSVTIAVLLVEAALVHVLLLTPTARRWRGQPPLHAQIIFVSGVSLAIGLKSTVQFFTKPKNRKGSIAFRVVLFLVLIGWPVFGMMAESYGFALLFSRFWPTAAVYLQKNSTIGWIFQHPYVTYTTHDRDDMNVSNKVIYSGMPWDKTTR
ncbi:vesicle transport protein GOT1-like, partial [Triticum urartu]|uniref:vesicle transport protein GOT1-like n=1 Tax=Triticum urartu TaxID=4572 RepID=UPI0020446343